MTAATATLTDFLLARIAEDEEGDVGDVGYAHFVRFNAARVLAECEAKRRIVEAHREDRWIYQKADSVPHCSTCAVWDDADHDGPPTVDWPCPTLKALAMPYADHPDYREEWRP